MELRKKMTQDEFQDFVIARLANLDTSLMSILAMQFSILKKLGVEQSEINRLLQKVVNDSARFVDFYDLSEDLSSEL
jgi:hypothetical protein